MLSKKTFLPIIKMALREDIGLGDITTNVLIDKNLKIKAKIIAKEKGIIAGLKIAQWTFQILDHKAKCKFFKKDGERVNNNETVLEIEGSAKALLSAERTVLNFLQRLSGIATLTRRYVEKVKKYNVKILDTRKIVPLWRQLDKYAVKVGGGYNHRFGLYDMILIKDNHLKIIGKIQDVIKKVKEKIPKKIKIEIETETLAQVKKVLSEKVDIIMLDNMSPKLIKKVVGLVKNKVFIEVSGGVRLSNVVEIAKTGVDMISVGELTHSPKALDLSLKIE